MNIILREKDIADIREYDVYVKNGGFEAYKKALGMQPDEVINEVKASNLRGRGGAGFPTGVKWSFIPKQEPVKYVVVNADESETGTFKDRQIMENNPYQMIEGALICAWAIQATAVYIYLRGEFWDIGHDLDERIAKLYEDNLAGEDIQGTGWSCGVYTHLGAGAYICGEETALLNSLEGKLGQPRVRPPFPAMKGGGLYYEPTVVNNVETLTNVPFILANGAEEYKKIGTEQSAGTKVYCLSGNINNPGNFEFPMGEITFRQLIFDYGGGITDGRAVKAILPSGGSGPILPATDEVLDAPLSYEGLQEVGSILGSASIIILDDSIDITWAASKMIKFFKHESCGKCTPCREGTYWIDKVVDRILAGKGTLADVDRINEVAGNMQGTTLCALGDFAANPILATIKHFPDDFKQHVQEDAEVAEMPGGHKAGFSDSPADVEQGRAGRKAAKLTSTPATKNT